MKDAVCSRRLGASVGKVARTGTGRCFGTFGELLQGVLPFRGRDFLVTLPISRYSTATFTVLPGTREVRVSPSYKVKSGRLAEELVRILEPRSGGLLRIESELPDGKGCASSSADMVATARAIQAAYGASISRASLARIMGSIEPTDGVMYPGVVSFYHREGVLRKFLGCLPPLTIIGLDEGGQVDTVEFNEQARAFGSARRAEYGDLLVGMERAVARGDLRSLGEISTRSAVLNQEILPKAHLDLVLEMRRRHGALGVVAAHSGTQLGLLFGPDPSSYRSRKLSAVVDEMARHCPNVRVHHGLDLRRA
jgi:uncharacterized protein involved in propanediol utilization